LSEINRERLERVVAHLRSHGHGAWLWENALGSPSDLGIAIPVGVRRQVVMFHDLQPLHVNAALVDALRAEGILPPPSGMVMIPVEVAGRAAREIRAMAKAHEVSGLKRDAAELRGLAAVLWAGEEPKGEEESA
jgi:hypothetical protein